MPQKEYSQSKRDYNDNYIKENLVQFNVKLNRNTDQEMIEHIKKQGSITPYFKKLVIKDMEENK